MSAGVFGAPSGLGWSGCISGGRVRLVCGTCGAWHALSVTSWSREIREAVGWIVRVGYLGWPGWFLPLAAERYAVSYLLGCEHVRPPAVGE